MSIDPQRIMADLNARLFRGLKAACIEIQNEAKDVVSVPAPRRLVTSGPRSKNPGIRYYVATTPATPGAPPRKLSGTGRARITNEVDKDTLTGRVGLNLPYMRRHETSGLHKWLSVAVQNVLPKLGGIFSVQMGSK